MKSFHVREIPDDEHRDYKSLCARMGLSMQFVAAELMRLFIETDGDILNHAAKQHLKTH